SASFCILLWVMKLAFCCDAEALQEFRKEYQQQKEAMQKQPFFHRHFWLARGLRLLTFGRWPRKNRATQLVDEEREDDKLLRSRMPFHSVLGYPVRNTGVEPVVLAYLALLAFQLVPLPSFVARVLSPAGYDLYASAARAAGRNLGFHPLSVDPFATLG